MQAMFDDIVGRNSVREKREEPEKDNREKGHPNEESEPLNTKLIVEGNDQLVGESIGVTKSKLLESCLQESIMTGLEQGNIEHNRSDIDNLKNFINCDEYKDSKEARI